MVSCGVRVRGPRPAVATRSHPRLAGGLLCAARPHADEWAKVKEKKHLMEK